MTDSNMTYWLKSWWLTKRTKVRAELFLDAKQIVLYDDANAYVVRCCVVIEVVNAALVYYYYC